MPVYVERLPSGQLLLSDGGETWMDLVSESYSPAAPSQPDERRLSALAALYGLNWHRRALVVVCAEADVLDAARRLTMAAASVDAWRVWAPEPLIAKPSVASIVKQAMLVAHKRGLHTAKDAVLSSRLGVTGSRCPLLIFKNAQAKAAVTFDDASADHVEHHARIARLDSDTPLVVVTTGRTARKLADSIDLRMVGIGIVPREPAGTGRQIVDMAEKIAA
jgi:hypothetical protein